MSKEILREMLEATKEDLKDKVVRGLLFAAVACTILLAVILAIPRTWEETREELLPYLDQDVPGMQAIPMKSYKMLGFPLLEDMEAASPSGETYGLAIEAGTGKDDWSRIHLKMEGPLGKDRFDMLITTPQSHFTTIWRGVGVRKDKNGFFFLIPKGWEVVDDQEGQ